MRAVLCNEFGSAANLVVGEVPAPVPGPGEVLLDVHACGTQFVDNRIVEGNSLLNTAKLNDHFGKDMRISFPLIPGSEAAGTVKEVGAGVSAVKVGDRVLATSILGALRGAGLFSGERGLPHPR